MGQFEFVAPTTLNDAVQAMGSAKGQARALAGGSDLIDQLRVGRRIASLVVDIKNIPDMQRLEYVVGEGLHVGTGVSCTNTHQYAPVRDHYTSIWECCQLIGSIQIQNRASMGGNVCNAAPSADGIPPLISYGARGVIAGPKGRREISLGDFFLGPGRSILEPDDLMVELIVPPPPTNSASRYLRFIPRNEMDIAVAGVGSMIVVDPTSSRCTQAKIVLASVAPTPVRAREAEAKLEGQVITRDLVRQAAELTPQATSPINDVRGSIEYRKELCKVLTRRTLERCMSDLGI